MKKKVVVYIVAGILLLGGYYIGVRGYQNYQLSYKAYMGPPASFTVNEGESFHSIHARLIRAGFLDRDIPFYGEAKKQQLLRSFKSGTYQILTGMTALDLFRLLQKGGGTGDVVITIPEGKNTYQIAAILEQEGISSKEDFLRNAHSRAVVELLGLPEQAPSVEGYLYPDTYRFKKRTPALAVIKVMLANFRNKVAGLEKYSNKLTPFDLIILASIVEKETGVVQERPIIAGVFLNRLKKNMRLQSDPTTIYGLYPKYIGNLNREHLRTKTAYNTYAMDGLPQGPICNPGLAAIRAVLSPEPHNYLYFVSRNNGTHIFTETYAEHRLAVNKFQKDVRMRIGRSWRDALGAQ